MNADIVQPSIDAYDEKTFRKINRPHFSFKYDDTQKGLIEFSHRYKGQLWLEIMLLASITDDNLWTNLRQSCLKSNTTDGISIALYAFRQKVLQSAQVKNKFKKQLKNFLIFLNRHAQALSAMSQTILKQ